MTPYDWPHLTGKLAPKVIDCLPLASMSAAEIERVKRLLVEIDRMEQRGLKAEALTREAQQDVANLDKQCSEIALNHGREIERLLVEIDRMEQAEDLLTAALQNYVDVVGGVHTGECPEDDTCDCAYKPMNDVTNAALGGKDGREM